MKKVDKEFICYKGEADSSMSVEIIKEYDLLLFPTYYEGEGLAGTIIDALFAGVPIVASDWKYNKDIIKNGINGFTFKTKDDKEFEKLLGDIYLGKYDIHKMKKDCIKESMKYIPEIAIEPLMKYVNSPKRVLCIVSGMNRGGAETFLMKIYRALDKNKYQMDFCVTTEGVYDEEIKAMGGKIFMIPQKSKNPIKSFTAIKKIVKENQYKSVLRTCQHSLASIDLLAAKLGGAKKLIYRSSNAGITEKGFGKFINSLFSFLPKIIPNVKIAPSTEAAEFVFGKKAVSSGNVIIMPNCLDYDIFEFDMTKREKIRRQLNLEDKHIIGHVGRFNKQKNHYFLIDIFNDIHIKDNKAHLLLIGKGELENDIRDKINRMNLKEYVTIISPVNNVNEYYMAMDVLIFPSFFEGMPNVIIEAQATDLPCILSDTITKEANITGKLIYRSLSDDSQMWANYAIRAISDIRNSNRKVYEEKGYIVKDMIGEYESCWF